MPIHDWTRVSSGTFHDFHNGWIVELRNALNGGVLPAPYYAQTEEVAGDVVPDVLALRANGTGRQGESKPVPGGAVAVAPPRIPLTAEAELDPLLKRQRRLAIRAVEGDQVVAFLEIVSRGNKSSKAALRDFVNKAVSAIEQGCHLLIVDLHPPSARDPNGIHEAIWSQLAECSHIQPKAKPLTAVSYAAGPKAKAYAVALAVDELLPAMPLFLEPGFHIDAPLESTYVAAYRGVPERWRKVLDGDPEQPAKR